MAKAYNYMPLLVIAAIGFGGWYLFTQTDVFKGQVADTGTGDQSGAPGVNVYGFATNVRVSAREKNTGVVSSLVNAELWDNSDAQTVGETSINGLTALTSTGPNNFDGYVMIGNDNFVSTTDRGLEIYYTKYPVSWRNKAGDISFENIPVYNESTLTITGYDDGTLETTTNFTIGAGETFTAGEIKIQAASKATYGNPDINKPIAVCFNASATGVGSSTGDWDEIRVASAYRSGTIPTPGFLAGFNMVGSTCDVLNTAALNDFGSYRFSLILDPRGTQNPADTASVYAHIVDATYYKDDNTRWAIGFGDESAIATDTDIGSGIQTKLLALG